VRVLSPDMATSSDLKLVVDQEWVRFTIPSVRTYSVAAIQLR